VKDKVIRRSSRRVSFTLRKVKHSFTAILYMLLEAILRDKLFAGEKSSLQL